MRTSGKNWVLITNDYVWGHNTSKATRAIVEANGGKIIEELLVPQNTRDFSSYLLKLQQLKPNAVATAVGGDDIKALRQQVVQLKLQNSAAWINNQQDCPDVYGLGAEAIFGVFGTTWYYRLDLPGVKEFVAAYQKQFPGMAIRVPGNVFHNGYMATRELLRCVEETGTTNNIAVIKNAMPKNITTPLAPCEISPTAFANPIMCTVWVGVSYLARKSSSFCDSSI